ncbi:putative NADH-flavin reductase [Saccharopolyspora erythraea NRRL 2338]|uniref:NAD-dependent epimerase/dehydratase n=2 Tax=Saccharopolyspora erythraea TaxID=1836 RepID=A4FFU5_SACEN|nr:SDR family oxidoreductase [Saccharopolyspora erythraea]EQD82380.1 epimerase [Saccharopolyspora erythraea D]PFG96626.1 putative NADH-flavin reductase [Saccharopolyspora erythraea NRRL 2338]QRK93106.1 SDR family oxidoreductase [Saccharopolyspora erythraea]CAM02920.1 NAD-dependent epimerase/dehydratase [Saccharopolyspora erythraea NRRL 2338]
MKITVLGATGGVGQHLLTHALSDGHQVTAAVRNPAKVATRHADLTVVRTDALDADSVKSAIAGADAVVSGIGAAGRRDPLNPASTSARAVVEAMSATEVRRLVVVSAAPLNRSGVGQTWLARRVFSPLLWAVLGDLYRDLERMEQVLRDSGLDWTSVRPPKLTDKPGRGHYRHTVETGPPGNEIARADVARAMLDFLGDPATIGHAVGVSA